MTRVKICGLTNFDDALVAVDAGADLLGFIFYEPSPRYVSPDVVKEIVASIRSQVASGRYQVSGEMNDVSDTTQHASPLFVGVFVNSPLEHVTHILNYCRLDAAQLHGEESPEFVANFKGRAFKALRPKSSAEAGALVQKFTQLPVTDCQPPFLPRLLLDAYHPTLYGGTGHVTDWSMAAAIARQHPILLAGSLMPDNVSQAIKTVRPWGVDVSSGVEARQGQKDHVKLKEFVKIVKQAISPINQSLFS